MGSGDEGQKTTVLWSLEQPLGTLGQAPAAKQADLWALDSCLALRLSETHSLLKSKRTGASIAVTNDVLSAVWLCRQFRTLDDHVSEVCSRFPPLGSRRSDVVRVLMQLQRQGFMVEAAQVLAGLARGAVAEVLPPLGLVAIRTCDRPMLLKRLLESLIANEASFAGGYRYSVLDDSRTDVSLRQNRQIVEELGTRLRVSYLGPLEQQRSVARLNEAFPEHRAAADLLLDGKGVPARAFTGGRLLNHLLLLGAGERIAVFDDDAMCEPRALALGEPGAEISDRLREPWFYRDRADAIERTIALAIDPIAKHSEMLGRTLASVLQTLPGKRDLETVRYLHAQELERIDAESQVLLTSNGTLGDPGTASSTWLYELDGDARQRLLNSEAEYERNRVHRWQWLGHTRCHFCAPDFLMTTTLTGLDNRSLMPPVYPAFRNEDHLFGTLVKFLYPRSLLADLPWALPHYPEPARTWPVEILDRPSVVGISRFLADLAAAAQKTCFGSSPVTRLGALSELYLGLAEASDEALSGLVRESGLHAQAETLSHLNDQLARHREGPAYWVRDMDRIMAAHRKAIQTDSDVVLRDLEGIEPSAQRMHALRAIALGYGEALRTWPHIWDFARSQSYEEP